jgi:hypothetical protein
MTPNLTKGIISSYDIQSRKMKYCQKGINYYFNDMAIYLCAGAINGCLICHETLLCELVALLFLK